MPSTVSTRLNCSALAINSTRQRYMLRRSRHAAPHRSTTQQQDAAAHELQLLRLERDALQHERYLLMQQVSMLHTMQQTMQQQLTQAQQMLHEMQHRYDRLLARVQSGGRRSRILQPPEGTLGATYVGALWPCSRTIPRGLRPPRCGPCWVWARAWLTRA